MAFLAFGLGRKVGSQQSRALAAKRKNINIFSGPSLAACFADSCRFVSEHAKKPLNPI